MSQSLPARRDGARWRGAITTVLMILVAAMIVRDILVRRWSSAPTPASDVSHRVP